MNETVADYGMGDWPLWAALTGLFVIVMGRSHLFYWLGRGLTTGATRLGDRHVAPSPDATPGDATPAPRDRPRAAPQAVAAADPVAAALPALPHPGQTGARARVVRVLHAPAARRGLALVHRFGPFAVTLAYLTVGVQTAVFVGSGVLRMSYPRFVVASVPGSIAWAFIWGTIGYAAFLAAVRLAGASPWVLAGAVALVAALVTAAAVRLRRRRRTTGSPATADEPV